MTTLPTMRALILDEFKASKLRAAEVPRPEPTAGQVPVRVKASGVNPLDIKIRTGNAAHAKTRLPAVLGMDLAGVVESVGPDVI